MMKLSTLPVLAGLIAGASALSAQSTNTQDRLTQTLQVTEKTNRDRSETEKQAIIDSLQKVYGPFLVYDSSNPDDVKKLEKMEKKAEKEQIKTYKKNPSSNKINPRIPSGNRVRTFDLHEADKYARDVGGYLAWSDVRGVNEIITYKKRTHPIDLSVLGVNYGMDDIIIGSHGLEIILMDISRKNITHVQGMNQRIEKYISSPTDGFFSAYITREQAADYLKNSDFLGFLSVILQKPITEITPRNIYMLIINGFSHKNIEDSRRK